MRTAETISSTQTFNLKMEFNSIKAAYNKNPSPKYKERKDILQILKSQLISSEEIIYDALKKDYGYRSEFDSLMGDLLPTVLGINYALKNLKKWMKPSKRHSGLMLFPSSVTVHYQPLGVVGVITPWNFPLFLSLGPTVQALAAGNRVMIKMSEFTPNANKALKEVVAPLSDHISIIEGEADVGASFSALPFNHLIFTGSTNVARHVARSAAENLTPLTLELGGKSPTVIDMNIDMNIAVDAISVGKSVNSGQICVAPDYILVPEPRKREFIDTFIKRYQQYHLNDSNKNSQTHIVTERQYDRLIDFLHDAETKGAVIHPIKDIEENQGRRIYPQLITEVSDDMHIMKEEIFGSLLPVITYRSIDDAISFINDGPRPLALYIMSSDKKFIDGLIQSTHSGGVAINDTALQVAADDAPFGGIGNSGMGHYHGYEGFLTFSKAKTVLHSSSWLPKNHFILKNRDLAFDTLRRIFLR